MNQSVSQSVLDQRNIYYAFLFDRKIGQISSNYELQWRQYSPLEAWDLVYADYYFQTNNKGVPDPQGWFKSSNGKLLREPERVDYNFVAQTVIASSYGLMQIMYPTA